MSSFPLLHSSCQQAKLMNDTIGISATAPFLQDDICHRLFEKMRFSCKSPPLCFLVESSLNGHVFMKRRSSELMTSDFHIPLYLSLIRSRVIFIVNKISDTWFLMCWQYDAITKEFTWHHYPHIVRFSNLVIQKCLEKDQSLMTGTLTFVVKDIIHGEMTERQLTIVPTSPETFLFLQHLYYL